MKGNGKGMERMRGEVELRTKMLIGTHISKRY